MSEQLARNTKHLGGLDIPGGGQVVVNGSHAYVGHMKPPEGTSIIDISDIGAPHTRAEYTYHPWVVEPTHPAEGGFYIPPPRPGQESPQSNDVDVDQRGLVYLLDRNAGLDILEYTP